MNFTLSTSLRPPPDLFISGSLIPYSTEAKFLGLIWDQKLTWASHISYLRGKCLKVINLIKTITGQKWGADQSCAIKIYKIYLRSKLDYGVIVYSSAHKQHLLTLEVIVRDALRTASGTFRSTPIETLHALCWEGSLVQRAEYLALRYYFKIRANLSNPAFDATTYLYDSLLFTNLDIAKPLSLRIEDMKNKFNILSMYLY